ncbi:hypothetical protein COCCADRAFT_89825, partial [Bipolaris zeicola 26-R-13]
WSSISLSPIPLFISQTKVYDQKNPLVHLPRILPCKKRKPMLKLHAMLFSTQTLRKGD